MNKLEFAASVLRCTVEQARDQYLRNARQMRRFAELAGHRGTYLRRTAREWKELALRYERIAAGADFQP